MRTKWKSMTLLAVGLVGLAWSLWAVRGDTQSPLFAPGLPVTVGMGSGKVILADLNGDGQLDLLTQHLLERQVGVQLGDGQGHFTPAAGSPIGFDYEPGTIALGDVNNDTRLDLGITNKDEANERVNLLLGQGTGGFSRAADSPFTVSAAMALYKPSLRFVDIDEDGALDMVTANGRRNSLEILFGDGHGDFSAGPALALEPGHDYYSAGLGDVDGDGHLDLVVVNSPKALSEPGDIVTKRGDGQGAFEAAPGSSLAVPPGPRFEALADMNGDQQLDLVLSHRESKLLSILLNDGQGGFAPAPTSPLKLDWPAFAVVAADANGDGQTDLLAATVDNRAEPYEAGIVALLNDGQGFDPAPGSPFPAGAGAYNLAVGDVNGDGKLDVAASSFEGATVTLLLGQ